MWLKGSLLAMWLFGFGTMAWLYFAVYRTLPPNTAVDIRYIGALTIQNPFWWAGLPVSFVLGFAIACVWSGYRLKIGAVGEN
jgi:hypothetical protein